MDKYEGLGRSAKPWWLKNIDKIFLGGGILYLLLVSSWLLFQSRQSTDSVASTTETVTVDQADEEFIVYLQQSLETLKQPQTLPASPPANGVVSPVTPHPQTVAIAPANQSIPLPPPPPGAIAQNGQGNGAPMAAPGSTTVVERYYYPVYPNGQAAPTTAAPPQPVAVAPPAVPMVPSSTKHDLVGVLESGELSSALFRWNGMTQRIQIGEAIGSSGWQLAAVNSQQAILSRQGKTRYLEVGQSF
ncbi:hypothetical protein D082_25950 [Synechocystis sp. PCC 6714]|nr:hypothetical protein D082_25950 [Synechocystis sp. PCC 6714]